MKRLLTAGTVRGGARGLAKRTGDFVRGDVRHPLTGPVRHSSSEARGRDEVSPAVEATERENSLWVRTGGAFSRVSDAWRSSGEQSRVENRGPLGDPHILRAMRDWNKLRDKAPGSDSVRSDAPELGGALPQGPRTYDSHTKFDARANAASFIRGGANRSRGLLVAGMPSAGSTPKNSTALSSVFAMFKNWFSTASEKTREAIVEMLPFLTARIGLNDVMRDEEQSRRANRGALDSANGLRVARELKGLRSEERDLDSLVHFDAFEWGGALLQVYLYFLRRDPSQAARFIREVFDGPVRPLWRGSNGFMLEEAHPQDLEFLLYALAQDFATDKDGKHSPEMEEMLRIKVFDSQGNIDKITGTLRFVKKLQDRGYPVTAEIAIPYSDGRNIEPNPYPEQSYVDNIIKSVERAIELGIAPSRIKISLKDMIGLFDKETLPSLLKSTIDALRERGLYIEIGVHCHETGQAEEAYLEAFKVVVAENWHVNFDTIGAAPDAKRGFVSTRSVLQKARDRGIPGTVLTSAQEARLDKLAAHYAAQEEENKAANTPEALTGEQLRKYRIPGGGQASFVTRVLAAKDYNGQPIGKTLGLDDKQLIQLNAFSLSVVNKMGGYFHCVTPGFQNNVILEEFYIKGMIRAGKFKDVKPGDLDAMMAIVAEDLEKGLSAERVKEYFSDIPLNIKFFFQDPMPGEVHPTLLEIAHSVQKQQPQARLPGAIKAVNELIKESAIKLPSGEVEARKARIGHVFNAVIMGGDAYKQAIREPFSAIELPHTLYNSWDEWRAAMGVLQSRKTTARDVGSAFGDTLAQRVFPGASGMPAPMGVLPTQDSLTVLEATETRMREANDAFRDSGEYEALGGWTEREIARVAEGTKERHLAA